MRLAEYFCLETENDGLDSAEGPTSDDHRRESGTVSRLTRTVEPGLAGIRSSFTHDVSNVGTKCSNRDRFPHRRRFRVGAASKDAATISSSVYGVAPPSPVSVNEATRQ